MQISTFKAIQLKANNLVNRLHTRLKKTTQHLPAIVPPAYIAEIPKPVKLPIPKPPLQRKELIFYEYKLIEKRLGKKLAAKGVVLPPALNDCTPLQAPIVKIKGGFMDNIGEIIDNNYNTIALPRKQCI